jgi:glycosyltransferase involved in cell wall biosynthesis
MPELRVGFAGLGGTWGSRLPFAFYPLQKRRGYVLEELPIAWRDFAGDEKGIILTVWNHSWLAWLTDSRYCPPEMREWIDHKAFELWGYIPVDSTRADGTLAAPEVLSKFDRLLAYTAFGQDAIGKTTQRPVPHLPHGVDKSIFFPQDQAQCRASFGLPQDQPIVGCVATNSERKDWGLAFEIAGMRKDSILWCHTDRVAGPDAYWDLNDLAKIHGVRNLIITTFHYLDSRMAQMYSACDVQMGIGHEGWGLNLSESLACGTPVVTMDWAGQTEFVPRAMRIPPVAFHQTGPGSYLRPVHDARQWAMAIDTLMPFKQQASLLDPKFEWDNCWAEWEKWVREGLG